MNKKELILKEKEEIENDMHNLWVHINHLKKTAQGMNDLKKEIEETKYDIHKIHCEINILEDEKKIEGLQTTLNLKKKLLDIYNILLDEEIMKNQETSTDGVDDILKCFKEEIKQKQRKIEQLKREKENC